jgi:anti-anti-sigma regulatory factor
MSVKPEVVALRAYGRVLGTRKLGSELGTELRERVAATEHAVLVDFDGVEVASSPVLDEIACALRAAITDNAGRFVVLTNLNEDVRDTLLLVLERRDMSLAILQDDELQLVGGRQHLEETLACAQELGRFTAAELAHRLELKLPNLHQRLVQLQAAGVVTRVEPAGGPQRALVFATPSPSELTPA